MKDCNVEDSWNLFHFSALIFYGVYGILCWFVPEQYGKYIYFRGNWSIENHSKNRILWYFMIGAGECCIHMSLLTIFMYKFGYPNNNQNNPSWVNSYLIMQILTWIKWTFTEAYYTYYNVEWIPIGCVHVFLCTVVLTFAVLNYDEVITKCF